MAVLNMRLARPQRLVDISRSTALAELASTAACCTWAPRSPRRRSKSGPGPRRNRCWSRPSRTSRTSRSAIAARWPAASHADPRPSCRWCCWRSAASLPGAARGARRVAAQDFLHRHAAHRAQGRRTGRGGALPRWSRPATVSRNSRCAMATSRRLRRGGGGRCGGCASPSAVSPTVRWRAICRCSKGGLDDALNELRLVARRARRAAGQRALRRQPGAPPGRRAADRALTTRRSAPTVLDASYRTSGAHLERARALRQCIAAPAAVGFPASRSRRTGTHVGCEHGVCGACTVQIDGVAQRACLTLAVQVEAATCARWRPGRQRRRERRPAGRPAGRLQTPPCLAVRLLHGGHPDVLRRLARAHRRPRRAGRRAGARDAVRPPVPLHGHTPIVAAVMDVARSRAPRGGLACLTSAAPFPQSVERSPRQGGDRRRRPAPELPRMGAAHRRRAARARRCWSRFAATTCWWCCRTAGRWPRCTASSPAS